MPYDLVPGSIWKPAACTSFGELPGTVLEIDLVSFGPFHTDDQVEPPVRVDVGPGDVLMKARIVQADRRAHVRESGSAIVAQHIASCASAVGLSNEHINQPIAVVIAPRGTPRITNSIRPVGSIVLVTSVKVKLGVPLLIRLLRKSLWAAPLVVCFALKHQIQVAVVVDIGE